MRTIALCCCLALATAAQGGPLVLLADDVDYKASKVSEAVFEGVLERTPSTGTFGGSARFNPYRLVGKEGAATPVREMYVGNRAALLTVHVGQRVRVAGKLVEVEADGKKRSELWAALLEVLNEPVVEAPSPMPKPPADGILARAIWQPTSAQRRGASNYVFRDGNAVAQAMKFVGAAADDNATLKLRQILRVPEIDWKKHMVVTVCAGLRTDATGLTIARIEKQERTLTIYYRLEASVGASGFGYPAETVLLDRFEGVVRVEEDKTPVAPKKTD